MPTTAISWPLWSWRHAKAFQRSASTPCSTVAIPRRALRSGISPTSNPGSRRPTRASRDQPPPDAQHTPPRPALGCLAAPHPALAAAPPDPRIATVGGRYYAMDRDNRWERTALGYAAIVDGVGERAPSATAAIQGAY